MSNQNNNQKVENKTEQVKEEPQVQQNAQAPAPAPVEQQPVEAPQKEGFGGWLKKHWKGVTAGVVGITTAVTSAVVAYKKGKAAGMNGTTMPGEEPEDYSLNPNE